MIVVVRRWFLSIFYGIKDVCDGLGELLEATVEGIGVLLSYVIAAALLLALPTLAAAALIAAVK